LTGIDDLKRRAREIGSKYDDREQRARRLFVEERAAALHNEREREFSIRAEISEFFKIPYANVAFCGSAQLGFSIIGDRLFEPSVSDLDAACISGILFQEAWIDVIAVTRAFTDPTAFGSRSVQRIDSFQDQIVRRGVIHVDLMPQSALSLEWSTFQGRLSRKHAKLFRRISFSIYMNEYAFCWKQDSVLNQLMRY
jgi:hypothetical protein